MSKRQIRNRIKLEIEQLNKINQLKSRYDNSSGINVTIEPCNYIHQYKDKNVKKKLEIIHNTPYHEDIFEKTLGCAS